ncbi:hypothetical protein WG904_03180 [Pedobacter sp. Du54]|uniref:hypothetical protein n=1 Tax=Pedobacter anseongensis TaxID=3133439 RepID=UPI0030AAAEB6
MNRTIMLIATAIIGITMQVNAQIIKQTKITPIKSSLATLVKLDPVTFSYDKNWLDKLSLKPTHSGFNVEELLKINQQLIVNQQLTYNAGKNNTKTAIIQKVDYEMLIPMLVGSIKEQQQQIDALKAEITNLKGKNAK